MLADTDKPKSTRKYLFDTRKYPLCGYILGVLTYTTAWDRFWKGDETLKYGFKILNT